MSELSIGAAARETNVKVPTIRYYEHIGLLPAAPRTEGKQRRYGLDDLTRLNFIRHARDLGFDLDAIRELLAISAQPDRSCADADHIARRHIAEIDKRIAHLVALRADLQTLADQCGQGQVSDCAILETLAHGS